MSKPNKSQCFMCGCTNDDFEKVKCTNCGEYVCYYEDSQGMDLCCVAECEICEEFVCKDCATTCVKCEKIFCQDCGNNGLCQTCRDE